MTKCVTKPMLCLNIHSQGGLMGSTRRLPLSISALAVALLIASCADPSPSGSGSGTAAPIPASSTAAPSKSAVADSGSTAPPTSVPPLETCAAFLPTAPCATYNSVAASANGKDLPWAAAGSVKVQLTSVDGTLQLAMKTECAPISGPATIAGNTLTVGKIATGAEGCSGAAGDHQVWLQEFLKRPIAMTYTQGTLSWVSGTDALSFKTE